jgi:hypothetical protein
MIGALKRHRVGVIGGLLVVAASVIAHLYVQSQVYYPVVHMTFPQGLSIAAVLNETNERQACGVTNDEFLLSFRHQCEDCRIVAARCERELDGVDLALLRGSPLPYPTLAVRDTRVAFIGPAEVARVSCSVAAAAMVQKGFKYAACIPPQNAAPQKHS